MNQTKPSFFLITGGARSGKSIFAETLAGKLGKKVAFIATAQALDEEMADKITQHRRQRPSWWRTYEESLDIERALEEAGRENEVIIIDCLTILVSNLMGQAGYQSGKNDDIQKILVKIKKITEKAFCITSIVIMVTNEVGMGIVPENAISRLYRDILGKANQIAASQADQVILMVSGIPISIKGSFYHDMV